MVRLFLNREIFYSYQVFVDIRDSEYQPQFAFCLMVLFDYISGELVPAVSASSPVPTEVSILEGLRVGKVSNNYDFG